MPLWNSGNEDTCIMVGIWKARISVNCLILDRSITVNRTIVRMKVRVRVTDKATWC